MQPEARVCTVWRMKMDSKKKNSCKKGYQKPSLRVYGDVRAITGGAFKTGKTADGKSGTKTS